MRTLFDGQVHVHYGQFYVESNPDDFEQFEDCRNGQVNGLCGAAVPGLLFLTTGLHTGNVPVVVEAHDEPPPIGPEWEDVVEASYRPASPDVALVEWGGGAAWPLPLVQLDHRVRYCINGMDEGRAADTRLEGEPAVDRYLLQFWPSPPAPDRVVRETSRAATYWHDVACREPAPERRAEAGMLAGRATAEEERREFEAARRERQEQRWGRLPSDRMLAMGDMASSLATLDPQLVDRLDEADDNTLRSIAAWATRRAYTEAGLADRPWAGPALDALDQRHDLPAPFDEPGAMWDALRTDPDAPSTIATSYDGQDGQVSQQSSALPAVWFCANSEPLPAAMYSLWYGVTTFGTGYPRLFAEVRMAFPVLASTADRHPDVDR